MLLSCSAVLFAGSPAGAVIDGNFDGNQHPNVGLIVAVDATQHGLYCTGTLVAPTKVLTAAHCITDDPDFPPAEHTYISFEPSALDSEPPPVVPPRTPIEGTPDPHPDWTWEGSKGIKKLDDFLHYQEKDIGILNLAQPAATAYPGITPAPIIAADGIASLKKKGQKTLLAQVGYGTQSLGPPGQPSSLFLDGTRNQSSFPLYRLTDRFVFGRANPNDAHGYGMPCEGDSGSPWYLQGGTEIIGVYTAFFGQHCNNVGAATRIDTGPARAFLRSRGLVP